MKNDTAAPQKRTVLATVPFMKKSTSAPQTRTVPLAAANHVDSHQCLPLRSGRATDTITNTLIELAEQQGRFDN